MRQQKNVTASVHILLPYHIFSILSQLKYRMEREALLRHSLYQQLHIHRKCHVLCFCEASSFLNPNNPICITESPVVSEIKCKWQWAAVSLRASQHAKS